MYWASKQFQFMLLQKLVGKIEKRSWDVKINFSKRLISEKYFINKQKTLFRNCKINNK